MASINQRENSLFFPIGRTMSPASAQRVANLAKLLRATERQPMHLSEIAELLGLSAPGARKYTRELRDLGILQVAPQSELECAPRRERLYVLSTDQCLLRRCWTELHGLLRLAADVQPVGVPLMPWSAPPSEPLRLYRDPLVSALFGQRRPAPVR